MEDVERAIVAGFGESSRSGVRAALAKYTDNEAPRVRLAILALADDDPKKISQLVNSANQDYRDLLYWAEWPEESSNGRVKRAEMAERYRRLGVPVPEALE